MQEKNNEFNYLPYQVIHALKNYKLQFKNIIKLETNGELKGKLMNTANLNIAFGIG